MSSEITLQDQKIIVNDNLRQVNAAIYNQEINLRVGKKAEDKAMQDRAIAELTRLEKLKDGYSEILSEIEEKIKASA